MHYSEFLSNPFPSMQVKWLTLSSIKWSQPITMKGWVFSQMRDPYTPYCSSSIESLLFFPLSQPLKTINNDISSLWSIVKTIHIKCIIKFLAGWILTRFFLTGFLAHFSSTFLLMTPNINYDKWLCNFNTHAI